MRSLSINKLTSKGLVVIIDELKKVKPVVKKLYLNSNKIDDDGIVHLVSFMKHNPSIESLSLSNNLLTDKGAEILASILSDYKALKYLAIADNKGITASSHAMLFKMVGSSNIKTFILTSNNSKEQKDISIIRAINLWKNDGEKINFSRRFVYI